MLMIDSEIIADVLKNEYWYAIKDDDMIMEPTGKKQLMEF